MHQLSDNSNLDELLESVLQILNGELTSEIELYESGLRLSEFADIARDTSRVELVQGAEMLGRVLKLAASWSSQVPDEPELVTEAVQFVQQYLPCLRSVVQSQSDVNDESLANINAFVQMAQTKWSDYLQFVQDDVFEDDVWGQNSTPVDFAGADQENDPADISVSNSEIALLLSAVSEAVPSPDDGGLGHLDGVESDDSESLDEVAMVELENDRELLDAYLDDAHRCLSSMEQAALAIEMCPTEKEPVQQFCRELHTLKGASATVGISELASYLHDLETSLDEVFSDDSANVEVETLFAAVDRVRSDIGKLQSNVPSSQGLELDSTQEIGLTSSSAKNEFASFASNEDSSIRIRAEKLDRLMDMLAELVVLRNRRENHVAEFNQFNEELSRCALRLRFAEEQQANPVGIDEPNYLLGFNGRSGSNTFSEVGKDISAVTLGFRELQKPLSHDNASISRFIRDFRQELMQLRRIPVSGLFQRLQRAARDAAKSEKKQVQVKLVGEHVGLEQEIQERLYESLLHVVRNSVSHGVETASDRVKRGKNPVGTVTLKASSNAQLLIIEVQDDGNGLDYVAVRKRGIEKGLLAPNQSPTDDELASLIFQPGFSTREHASAVAGRGVGMDIVARTIDQLHGRIEVDSVGGQGTTMRLSIPLRSGIEHVMVFRSDGQLFALPLQSVTATKLSRAKLENVARLSCSSVFSFDQTNEAGSDDVLLLRHATDSCDGDPQNSLPNSPTRLALAVDEMIGPEEVVVRGLPKLLKNHPLFCGVILAGSGESVLLLDSDRVVEFCQRYQPASSGKPGQTAASVATETTHAKHALVVDDSLTARKMLCKLLHEHGYTTAEAGDGIEAIEHLHRSHFDLVLTDLDMPRLGGLELLTDIHCGQYCDSPVVVVSSRDDEVFRLKAMNLGAIQYVTKPVTKTSIAQLVEQFQPAPVTSQGD